ncbi:hypothetical protein [Rhodococcus pyridinivorans]|uniref:hypothetical protein n=1 Tax=Rhodococcus pyridinivorans TaxID=103816 RepID=UPI0002F58E89|nr:hypothetical protein [Rhodococcus pyridinivorans]MCD2140794.1 hypothetical protein [Rhodococcus pyridinivorans]
MAGGSSVATIAITATALPQSKLQAELYAQMNGWAIHPTTLCPGCATLFTGEFAPLAHADG